jgi:hypothetical protein
VVADRSGRFVGLDLATGRSDGLGSAFQARTAPVAAAVAFAPDRRLLFLRLRHNLSSFFLYGFVGGLSSRLLHRAFNISPAIRLGVSAKHEEIAGCKV